MNAALSVGSVRLVAIVMNGVVSVGKKYASEQAIPAWMKVKDSIVETTFEAKRTLARFRGTGGNPSWFHKLKNQIVTMYELIRMDYIRDDKLKKKYPDLITMDSCMMSVMNNKSPGWWLDRYNDVTGVIYDLGITKITREEDDDDFAGVDGF